MKIKQQDINLEQFDMGQFYLYDEKYKCDFPCFLVKPKLNSVEWNESNLIFRSSIWTHDANLDLELVSPGFKKFFNLDERPDLFPFDYNKWIAIEKIDGSCIIVSKYKGNLIVRTRGTVDAITQMPNGQELNELINLPVIQAMKDNEEGNETLDFSLLFEWVTPTNRIVINYGDKPEFYLIGKINHKDYSLETQYQLDAFANIWNLKRPKTYAGSLNDKFEDLMNTVKQFENQEGVCVYYNQGQSIRKLKSVKYLRLHAFRSNLTIKNISELWLSQNKPARDEFENYILNTFDFECLEYAKPIIEELYIAIAKVNQVLFFIQLFVNDNSHKTQKEFANEVLSTFKSIEQTIAFSLKQRNGIDDKTYKKILFLKLETKVNF